MCTFCSLLREVKKVISGSHSCVKDEREKKERKKPEIDKSYQFGNGHSTARNNAVARWELRFDPNNASGLSRNLENRKPAVPLSSWIKS